MTLAMVHYDVNHYHTAWEVWLRVKSLYYEKRFRPSHITAVGLCTDQAFLQAATIFLWEHVLWYTNTIPPFFHDQTIKNHDLISQLSCHSSPPPPHNTITELSQSYMTVSWFLSVFTKFHDPSRLWKWKFNSMSFLSCRYNFRKQQAASQECAFNAKDKYRWIWSEFSIDCAY